MRKRAFRLRKPPLRKALDSPPSQAAKSRPMGRLALRHWTGILVTLALLWWALFYLPKTPAFAVVELKRAIDARDGGAAARYVDFESVVRHAGYEIVNRQGANSPLSRFFGKGAVDVFTRPMAQIVRVWAEKEVGEGAREVQMPAAAVLGALLLMHRDGGAASTRFRDSRGHAWEVRLARNGQGVWQVTEVKNIAALLEKLESGALGRPGR